MFLVEVNRNLTQTNESGFCGDFSCTEKFCVCPTEILFFEADASSLSKIYLITSGLIPLIKLEVY